MEGLLEIDEDTHVVRDCDVEKTTSTNRSDWVGRASWAWDEVRLALYRPEANQLATSWEFLIVFPSNGEKIVLPTYPWNAPCTELLRDTKTL